MCSERVWVPPGGRSVQILRWKSESLCWQLEPRQRQVSQPRKEAAFENSFGQTDGVFRFRGFVFNIQQVLDGEGGVFGWLASLLRVRVCHHRFTLRHGSPSTTY